MNNNKSNVDGNEYLNKIANNLNGINIRVSQSVLRSICLYSSMKGNDWRIFTYLLSILEWGNTLPTSQAEIAKELEMQPSTVCRAFKRMIDENIVIFDKSYTHKNNKYGINLNLAIYVEDEQYYDNEVFRKKMKYPPIFEA